MEYLTLDEAAKVIGKSTQTVRRMIKQKKIKAEMQESQYGKRYMIPKGEINQAYTTTIETTNLVKQITPESFAFEVVHQLREENKDLREAVAKLQQQQSATLLLLEEIKSNQQQPVKKWWKVW